MARCKDTRECCLRNADGTCNALTETYEHDGDCPFCKERAENKGRRARRKTNATKETPKISAQAYLDSRVKLSAKNAHEKDCQFYVGGKRLCKATHNKTCEGCGFYTANHATRTNALADHLRRMEGNEIRLKDEVSMLNHKVEEREDALLKQADEMQALELEKERIAPLAQIGKSVKRYADKRRRDAT